MAEYLVTKTNYWIELGAPRAIAVLGEEKFYRTTHQEGDIVEVQEDGYFATATNPKGRGWNRKGFTLVLEPGASLEDRKHLMKPRVNPVTKWIEERRAYNINVTELRDAEGKVCMNATAFGDVLTEKARL